VIRVAVPDLEQIARLYLVALERAGARDPIWMRNYDWIMLELYDQTVRERSGGEMIDYLQEDPLPNEEFLVKRNGSEVLGILAQIRSSRVGSVSAKRPSLPERARYRLGSFFQRSQGFLMRKVLGEKDYKSLQVGRFRRGGEVHKWMYDRYSLARALAQAGFEKTTVASASNSRIPKWTQFNLDTEPDGTVYKPDSLYMEAIRP
jgi:sulfur carrier protein ThiS